MTYTNFLRNDNLKDDIETYKEYLKKYDKVANMMNNNMFEQYADATYGIRFTK